ncbi:MAG: histidine--tRNA ligase [Candidatus Heimdallarchaeota archaeon]|nr:MAG: histidine--tRNA ligase [Candidatus Heimdallarchaeota archaeon]
MVELSLLKGTNDHLPEEQVLREKILEIIKEVFQLYGFRPLTTPILEMWDILSSKYAGGAEILKETYRLTDQGNRDLGLRYDLSVPLSRLVGMNPRLRKPFKRYEIGPCFRDGPIKKGRYREFIQCDADIIGVASTLADAECLALAHHLFTRMGLEVYLEVNNRKLLTGILLAAGVPEPLLNTTILSVDKLKKIGIDGVREELKSKNVPLAVIDEIYSYFNYEGSYLEVLDQLEPRINNEIGKEGIAELKQLYHYLQLFNLADEVKLLYSLARGLEIYTGTVFEAFLKESGIIDSSLCGGGRYDKIIGKFIGSEDQYPATGISFGLDIIYDAVAARWPSKSSVTDIYLVPVGNQTFDPIVKLTTQLRQNNIRAEFDLLNRNLSKNLDYANRLQIPFVIILGERDLSEKSVTLRVMKDGTEQKVALNRIVKKIAQLLENDKTTNRD